MKYLILALIALAAALGAWGYKGKADSAKLRGQLTTVTDQRDAVAESLRKSEAERKRIASVSRELAERLKANAARAAEQQRALNEAIKANPDWAAAAVPDSVWNALGVRSSGSGTTAAGPGVDHGSGSAPAAGKDQR